MVSVQKWPISSPAKAAAIVQSQAESSRLGAIEGCEERERQPGPIDSV